MTAPARYAEVVLPVPVSRAYTYQIPDALAPRVVPGARVVVPVRRGAVVGIVTAVSDQPSAVSHQPSAVSHQQSAVRNIKSISAAPDDQPALSPALLGLGRWMSD